MFYTIFSTKEAHVIFVVENSSLKILKTAKFFEGSAVSRMLLQLKCRVVCVFYTGQLCEFDNLGVDGHLCKLA